jgi:hypothetical protein
MRRIAMVAAVGSIITAGSLVLSTFSSLAQAQVVPALNAQPLGQPIFAQPATTAQRSAEADVVRGWYRDYLGREPGPELTAWVELLRGGMSPVDVQATILGSDEFFNSRGRDQQTFVLETLQAVTWQQPTANELNAWTNRLTQLRGDRFALVREILMANSANQPTVATGTIVDLSTRLVSAARLLGDTAAFELTGTLQGQQVTLRSQALYDATESFRRAVAQRNFRPESLDQELRVVERSFDAVQTALSNPPGTAPSTSSIARRFSTLLSDTRASLRLPGDPVYGGGGYPTPLPTLPSNPGNVTGVDTQRILVQIDSISRGTQSIIQLYQSRGATDYTYNTTLRDLDTFAGQLDNFRLSVQRASSAQRLQWEFQQLQQQGARIRPQLLQGQPPVFTRLYWQSVESGIAQLGDTLARHTGGQVVSNPGTIPTNPTPVYRPNQEVLLTIDQAMAQTDAFLAGLSPFVFGIPEVPRLQRDMRTLKEHLAELRQSVVRGDSQLAGGGQMQLLKMDFDTAYTRWSSIVENYKLINYTKLSPVGRSIDTIDVMLREDKTYIDVARPVYGNRIDQLLQAMNQDIAGMNTALQPLVGYTEQRAMMQTLSQLSSYSQTLANLQRDRVRTYDDQRRTVALMQQSIQLLDANTVRLEDRALALRDRNNQLQAAEVRRSLGRIAGALNDLEREVNQ